MCPASDSRKTRLSTNERLYRNCDDLDRHDVDPVTNVVCEAVGLGGKLGLDPIDAVAVVCLAVSFCL